MTQQPPPAALPQTPLPSEIDLTLFADAIDHAREDNNTCLVATTNGTLPDVAFKGSLMAWDKDHLAWWERGLRETYAALQASPNVAIFARNPVRDRRVVRVYGVAVIARVDRVRAAGQDIRRS